MQSVAKSRLADQKGKEMADLVEVVRASAKLIAEMTEHMADQEGRIEALEGSR